MRNIVLAFISLLLLAGCQHTPPLTTANNLCQIKRYSLEQPLPGEEEMTSILGDRPGDMLLLSGGSQNGAFGAGFLQGWHSTGDMPQFSFVTGISTGALQATGAFIGRPEITVEGYTIDAESELLEAYVDGSALESGLGAGPALTAIRKGAIADLVPLRAHLDRILTQEVLEAVAARYDPEGNGPYLLVGATDVDLGRAVAFDMTELASRYATEAEGSERKARLKECYIEALIASSIVPPGAKPVFIDNRMYIDGGVRYAVFDDRIGKMLLDGQPDPTLEVTGPSLYILLNSDGTSKERCGKVNAGDCTPPSSLKGQHEDWDILGLALRTVKLLVGQVERSAISRAADRAEELPSQLFFVRIQDEDLDDPRLAFEIRDFAGKKTCNEWRADDDRIDQPLEFHKRYMRCMIQYGKSRGAAQDWNLGPS